MVHPTSPQMLPLHPLGSTKIQISFSFFVLFSISPQVGAGQRRQHRCHPLPSHAPVTPARWLPQHLWHATASTPSRHPRTNPMMPHCHQVIATITPAASTPITPLPPWSLMPMAMVSTMWLPRGDSDDMTTTTVRVTNTAATTATVVMIDGDDNEVGCNY
ncbi:hypothetical protein EDB83DRAFT_2419112 [Lactarius deliciosus]|nr:hypothetical protein EDB83DRAFT_2419112 [Lactarius deliciosus]